MLTEQVNERVRKRFLSWIKENGFRMKWVSDKLSLEYTGVSKWKNGKLNYGQDTLNRIELFIEKYTLN